MTQAIIYHNPRCSKSRASLAILEQQHTDITVIKYLDTPPSEAAIKDLLSQLGMGIRDILRNNESDYKEQGFADTNLSEAQLITLLAQYPKVLERPIVSYAGKAVIGRPPENILSLFND